MSDQENQDLIQYRFGKALETLAEAEFLMKNQFWNNTVNRLYYSCYYAVSALLASIKVYPKTHAGTSQMFSLHFIKPGIFAKEEQELFAMLLNMRQDADYEDFVDYEEKDVTPLIQPAKEFINHIQVYIAPFLN